MKSVTKRYVISLLAIALPMVLALVLGCQRRGGALEPEVRSVQIRSTVDHEKVSKAIASQTTPLEDIRFLRQDGDKPISMAGAQTYLGNRSSNGSISWQSTVPVYDHLEKHAYFVAYYPSATETLGKKIDWAIDGKTDLLLSQPWDAGTHSAPKTGAGAGEKVLTFDHVLAQLNVVFKAESGADYAHIQRQYGKITGIKLAQSASTATYTYSTNKVTFSGSKADIALWQANCDTPFAAMAVPVAGNSTVNAGGLFAPSTGVFTLLVTTEIASISVPVQLLSSGQKKDFEAGLKHTVTMTFKADRAEVVVSGCSIVDWTAKYTSSTDVEI